MVNGKEVHIVGGPNGAGKTTADKWYLFNNSGKMPELIANNVRDQLKIIGDKQFTFFLDSIREA